MQDRLYAGQSLPVNGSLTSANGKHALVLQRNGNLVLYRVKDQVARWATATDGRQVDLAEMQANGNFVMFGPGHSCVWDSATDQYPGAFLVLQNDGDLVIYDGNGARRWSSDTSISSSSVAGFLPSRNRYHFSNMLADSFNMPGGIETYQWLMDPALPDHETVASRIGFGPHGRTWRMVYEEWPCMKEYLDNNRLCPLALVQVKSPDAALLDQNHVVVVYGYEVDGTDLTLRIYDPNFPNEDDAVIMLSIADPTRAITVSRSHGDEPIYCFFRLGYNFESPDFVLHDGSVEDQQSAQIIGPDVLERYGRWSMEREVPDAA